MFGSGSSTILNEKIIFYTLNYPDLQGIGFWAIEKVNKKTIEYSTGIGHSKVIGEFVSALISLGGKRDTEY